MDSSYDEILSEIKIFARNYSQCHLIPSKWRSHKTRTEEIPEKLISVHEIDDKTYALIYRPEIFCIEAFKFDTILKRISIKRSELLVKEVLELWKLLNPFHLPGISKTVYIKFYEFIHFKLLNNNAPLNEYEKISKIDAEIDFAGSVSQHFSDFYDTFFENIDAYTKSTLVTEYCRIIKRITSEVKGSSWIKSLDLHNKLHSEGKKANFPNWALPHIRVKSMDTTNQFFRSTLFTANAPLRLLSKSHKKEKSNFEDTRYEKMTSPWNDCEKIKPKVLTPVKTPETKIKKNRILTSASGKNESQSPFSKKLKAFKDKKIIEKIVQGRQEKPSDQKERVLNTPLSYLF